MANMQPNKTPIPEQDPILRGKNFQEVAWATRRNWPKMRLPAA